MALHRPRGMTAFTLVWFGQVVSLMGSSMSGFALTIWAWKLTGSATALSLMAFFSFGPSILFSPFAGVLVDRWNKKLVMMLSDLAAGLATIVILILYSQGILQIWHMYIAGAFTGIFQSFQWPAYSAAISVMIPKEHYSRASGMMSLAEWGSGILSPVMAGALIGVIGVSGILIIDIVTFIFAIAMLLWIFVPPVPRSQESLEGQGSIFKEALFGFRYILNRRSLLFLQLVFFSGNLMSTLAGVLTSPMILARTGDNAAILGLVQSVGSAGGIAGSILISIWGGPKKKVYGVLGGWFLSGLLGEMLYGLRFGLPVWIAAAFFASFFGPIINSSNQAIWQSKVPPDLQGRVFSIRRMIAQITAPLAMLIAGPLADFLFEPTMKSNTSPLSTIFAPLTGTGPGAGMGTIIFLSGVVILGVAISGWMNPLVRDVETLIPDHDTVSSPS
ncbi:MFS transporter [Anaerolinea thermophila]|uniref:MFS transporter n=2 Tax=Anaerolinea TaxID=233189 RepID=UPI0026ECA265|nr:MFS transporter [Anaerolinea thermophila]